MKPLLKVAILELSIGSKEPDANNFLLFFMHDQIMLNQVCPIAYDFK